MSAEVCRHPASKIHFMRYRWQESQSIAALQAFSIQRENNLPEDQLENGQLDVQGHGARIVPEIATSADLAARKEEQIERAKRMLEVGHKITPQWRSYLLNNAPDIFLSLD